MLANFQVLYRTTQVVLYEFEWRILMGASRFLLCSFIILHVYFCRLMQLVMLLLFCMLSLNI